MNIRAALSCGHFWPGHILCPVQLPREVRAEEIWVPGLFFKCFLPPGPCCHPAGFVELPQVTHNLKLSSGLGSAVTFGAVSFLFVPDLSLVHSPAVLHCSWSEPQIARVILDSGSPSPISRHGCCASAQGRTETRRALVCLSDLLGPGVSSA